MSNSKGIPISNPKTGEITYATAPQKKDPKPETLKQEPQTPISSSESSMLTRSIMEVATLENKQNTNENTAARRKEKIEINSLADLLTYAYSLKGKRIPLNTKMMKAVASNYRVNTSSQEQVLQLAAADTQLIVVKQLLLLAISITGFPNLRFSLSEAARTVLLQHSAFKGPHASSLLIAPSEGVPLTQALAELQKYNPHSNTGEENANNAKKASNATSLSQLRENACYCLAMWYANANNSELSRILDSLYATVWEPAARKLKSEELKWRAITETKDIRAVALVCEAFRRDAQDQWQKGQKALEDSSKLVIELNTLRADHINLQSQLSDYKESSRREISALQQQLDQLKTAAEIQAVHQRNDAKQIQARLLRRLKTDLSNLEEGLTAIRRTEPKVHVMMDIAERVTDAIRNEIRNLQGEE